MQKVSEFIQPQPSRSFKALKPKAKKSLNSIKALKLEIKRRLEDTSDRNDMFYNKCAWNMSEAQIYGIIERSQKANSKVGYFLGAASKEMRS